jgi:phosphinothricin acetyltransferase
MRAYLIITGILFGLLALAHLLRTIAERSRLGSDPWFLLEGPGIGLICAGFVSGLSDCCGSRRGRERLWEESAVDFQLRNATEADLPDIVDIYNQSIPAGWSTADTRPVTVAERLDWFRKFDPARRPIWVAEVDGKVIATAYVSSFYAGRPAYDATGEVSVYVATAYHRLGIGRQLKLWVIEQCPRLRVTTLVSMHFDHNQATRRINESLGFQQMGHLPEIAVVQGQRRGLVISALRIPPKPADSAPSQPLKGSETIDGSG